MRTFLISTLCFTMLYSRICLGLSKTNVFSSSRVSSSRLFGAFIKGSDEWSSLSADVIIIGGGHAGCEAAAASARVGANTILVTQRLESVGEMSCNPSIGGIGKGHLVREIDALDGIMGRIIDASGIHFKMLNQRKGPAVRGPRAQADRDLYKKEMQEILLNYPNLRLVEASVEDIILDEAEKVQGIKIQDGREIKAERVVITTGTFLRGTCYLGRTSYPAGRHIRNSDEVEPPSIGLAITLERLKFPIARLKTGTPPRLLSSTIDWDSLEKQPSDIPPPPFSYMNIDKGVKMKDQLINCAKTYTNEETHRLVLENQHLLPDYDGADGAGVGPRYCPSIFKKVQRFPDKDRHIIWLEPEGLDSNMVYPNGLSGPFPLDVQLKIVRSIAGLENAEIDRAGYDVEYDFVDPQSVMHTLETKIVPGLYLAGQILGTTGYEEAASQGIVAGANAALSALGRGPLVIGRDEGYIGVLVDDLVTRGTNEPYRMFTSRAEYRLSLRQDNADIRLTRKGMEVGMVSEERKAMLQRREDGITAALDTLGAVTMPRPDWAAHGEAFQMRQKDGKYKSAAEVLSMPDITLSQIVTIIRDLGVKRGDEALASFAVDNLVYDTVEAISKYSNYLSRQEDEMARWRKSGAMLLPTDMLYTSEAFPSFSAEELERLQKSRPTTLHAASQLQGITPHTLIYLHSYITRGKHHIARNVQAAKLAALNGLDTAESSLVDVAVEDENPMHPDFNVTPQEAGLRKHYQEIDDVIVALQEEIKN